MLRLIIAYKLGRAALSLLAGLGLVVLAAMGWEAPLQRLSSQLHAHAASALAVMLTGLLESASQARHSLLLGAALVLDAGVAFVEGWSLQRGWRWGPWFVVAASSALLPFELGSLVKAVSWPRAAMLLLNLAIVAWLLRKALRSRHPAPPA